MFMVLDTWKLVLAAGLAALILASVGARAPRWSVPRPALRRLVLTALVLYGIGGTAWLTGQLDLAATLYAGGIVTAAVAVWLSRGGDRQERRGARGPVVEDPPPEPGRLSPFDWERFERELLAYTAEQREPAGRS